MKRILLSLVLISVAILLVAEPIAYLSTARGKVNLTRNSQSQKFKPGDFLENLDMIQTQEESYAAFKYIDGGAELKVFPHSGIDIKAKKVGKVLNKSITIYRGSMLANVASAGTGFEVDTPNAMVSVRGTSFLTKVARDKQTEVIVLSGEVLVELKENAEIHPVTAGNTAHIDEWSTITIRKTSSTATSELEQAEIEASLSKENKSMRIQVVDDNGNIRYINVTY